MVMYYVQLILSLVILYLCYIRLAPTLISSAAKHFGPELYLD